MSQQLSPLYCSAFITHCFSLSNLIHLICVLFCGARFHRWQTTMCLMDRRTDTCVTSLSTRSATDCRTHSFTTVTSLSIRQSSMQDRTSRCKWISPTWDRTTLTRWSRVSVAVDVSHLGWPSRSMRLGGLGPVGTSPWSSPSWSFWFCLVYSEYVNAARWNSLPIQDIPTINYPMWKKQIILQNMIVTTSYFVKQTNEDTIVWFSASARTIILVSEEVKYIRIRRGTPTARSLKWGTSYYDDSENLANNRP